MPAPSLRLSLASSRLLAAVLLSIHAAAGACAAWFLPGWPMPALACVALAASLVFHIRRDALQLSGDAVVELIIKDGGQCELILRNGDTLAGNVEGSTFVAPLLTVVNVRLDGKGKHRSVILLPDRAPAEELRRVRVWLRHRMKPDVPGSRTL